jgi:AMMECR1 domain-containing protein
VRPERHPFPAFAWKCLRRPLGEEVRGELTRTVRGLLRFQRTLEPWPVVRRGPDATTFVSLYANGRLCGCYGCDEGEPPERLIRAFLRAAHDGRFATISPGERRALVAQVSYPRCPRLLNPETAPDEIGIGTHGLALVRDRAPGAIVLPHVARDERLGPRELLAALLRKAGVGDEALREGALYAFETEDVVVRGAGDAPRPHSSAIDAAATWLASISHADGAVTFAVDSRARRLIPLGEMHHGRAAVVVQALAAHGKRPALVARAQKRLERDIRAGLKGASVPGWPVAPGLVAGTIALSVLAGASLADDLLAFIHAQHEPLVPWHAAQAVAALGSRAPDDLWALCVADLDRHPFAPWTLIAADARGDRPVRTRVARAVAEGLRADGPHRGGASVTALPETALTAIAVEALARHPAPWARAAMARGREFLGRMQLVGPRITAALDPELAYGAFSASPAVDFLRCDVTAHALLAMMTSRTGRPNRPALESSPDV